MKLKLFIRTQPMSVQTKCYKHLKPVQVKYRLPLQTVQISPFVTDLPPVGWLAQFKLAIKRMQQSFRLMVGVHDYQTYVLHMQSRHPEQTPMTEKEFHRYCLEARFPSKGGKINKCPC
jgi:uncharacterized short protein YbdD (DUF466 family)